MLDRRQILKVLVGAGAAAGTVGLSTRAAAARTTHDARAEGGAACPVDDDELAESIDAYVRSQSAIGAFSGAVLVAHGARHVYSAAVGFEDRELDRPNRLATLFNLGSINKSFTAVAIAQLAERGVVAFDAPIARYLPQYPQPAGGAITVHHLLTHRSGLVQSYLNDHFRAIEPTLQRMVDYLPAFVDLPLLFPPGTRSSYSNAGYVVLGAIIEAVSGETYYDYVQEHIYRPAGMGRTDSYRRTDDVPNLAVGYTFQGPGGTMLSTPQRNDALLEMRGSSAGGGYSSLGDLWRFAEALTRGRLLAVDTVQVVTSGKEPLQPSGPLVVAYGFLDRRSRGTRIVENSGGAPGVNAGLQMYRDLGYTPVVLANYDPPAATAIAARIEDQIVGDRNR
jgi:CubicO group peptidase (beta-lactamase class C family)